MYSRLARTILLPFHERILKRRNTWKYRQFLEESQWWSRDQLLSFQWEETKKLLDHAYRQVPYWRDTFRALNITPSDIGDHVDFLALPPITRSIIRENKQRMIADNYRGETWTKSTGGSTGEPLELDYTPDSYDWRVAVSRRGYGWAGIEDGMRQVWIWGVPVGDRPAYLGLKERLHQRVLGHLVFNSFKFDDRNMHRCLKAINRYKPSTIVGYTNPLFNFAKFVEAHGGLEFRPHSVISAAEKLFEYQREGIERAFKCPVFNTYGSREFMLIAAECDRKTGLHLSVENLFVEIIKDDGTPAKPGEMGDLVITDLHNYGMPFIRYRIGDMAVASEETCSCGRGLPLIGEVVGRTLDIIRTRDGKYVPGEFFPHLMKEFRGVKQFQVIQNELNSLIIKVVKDDQFTGIDLDFMKREIGKIFGTSLVVDIQFVDAIPLTRGGKYRVTISNVGV